MPQQLLLMAKHRYIVGTLAHTALQHSSLCCGVLSQEEIKPNQQFLYIIDYYNKSECKLAKSIIEENNTNLTINTTIHYKCIKPYKIVVECVCLYKNIIYKMRVKRQKVGNLNKYKEI
jgi:hypothetical protein